jgi:hypothetical protein
MKVRKWAEFSSDLPDDCVDDGHIVRYCGKSVAESVAAILVRLGCTVAPPRYDDAHGWELDLSYQKRRLCCQVTLVEKYLLNVDDISWVRAIIGGYHPALVDLLRRLAAAMNEDPHFRKVRWFRADEVHSGAEGAREPVTN